MCQVFLVAIVVGAAPDFEAALLTVHGVVCEVHVAADYEQVLRPEIQSAILVQPHERVVLGEAQVSFGQQVVNVDLRRPYLFHLTRVYHVVWTNPRSVGDIR